MRIMTFLVLLSVSSFSWAMNTGDRYFGVSYGAVNLDAEAIDDWDTGVAFARFGTVINPGVAAEAFLGLGIQDDEWTSPNGCDSQTVSTDSIIGAQIKVFKDQGNLNLHAAIGMNMVSVSVDISGTASCYGFAWSETYDDSETAITYGFGVNFAAGGGAVTLDYQAFYDDDYDGVDLFVSGLLIGYQGKM